MASLNRVKKAVNKRAETMLRFESTMYTNVYGSLVICAAMMQNVGAEKIKMINLLWRKARKNPELIDWDLSDKEFIEKTLAFFDIEKPKDFPIAFVQYGANALFAPYIDGRIFPLREDGIKTLTLTKGKIYPIDFKERAENENE